MAEDVLKVLIVDNAPLMCDFVHSVVTQMDGLTLLRANSYRAACDILASESIAILLTELNIDAQADLGLALIGRLRADEFAATSARIPIIVCSSGANRSLVRDALLFDVADFLIKPISTDIVQAKLVQHLAQPKS